MERAFHALKVKQERALGAAKYEKATHTTSQTADEQQAAHQHGEDTTTIERRLAEMESAYRDAFRRPAMEGPCHLLALPAELRQGIYEMCIYPHFESLELQPPAGAQHLPCTHPACMHPACTPTLEHPLLYVSHFVRQEILPTYLRGLSQYDARARNALHAAELARREAQNAHSHLSSRHSRYRLQWAITACKSAMNLFESGCKRTEKQVRKWESHQERRVVKDDFDINAMINLEGDCHLTQDDKESLISAGAKPWQEIV